MFLLHFFTSIFFPPLCFLILPPSNISPTLLSSLSPFPFSSSALLPLVNDTVVGDPLLTVPIYIPDDKLKSLQLSNLSLCYEIHGKSGKYFNLVTDECTSVNARWVNITDYLNVIDQVGIRAVDSNSTCRNIQVDLNQCAVSIDGVPLTTFQFREGNIFVRRSGNRVRVSVPNCNEQSLVMWVFCQSMELQNPFDNTIFRASMIKYVVMRGLNFGHRHAHGIIGTFWCQYMCVCV